MYYTEEVKEVLKKLAYSKVYLLDGVNSDRYHNILKFHLLSLDTSAVGPLFGSLC